MTALTDTLKDVLSVGIASIDEEHAQLFACLDRLMLSVNTRKGGVISVEVLDALQCYSETHFRNEEALMREHGYAALAVHRNEHQSFIDEIRRFRHEADDSDPDMPQQMTAYLMQWLTAHILRSDKRLAAYLRTRAVR